MTRVQLISSICCKDVIKIKDYWVMLIYHIIYIKRPTIKNESLVFTFEAIGLSLELIGVIKFSLMALEVFYWL